MLLAFMSFSETNGQKGIIFKSLVIGKRERKDGTTTGLTVLDHYG